MRGKEGFLHPSLPRESRLALLFYLRPRVLERDSAVEHGMFGIAVRVGAEVAHTLELHMASGGHGGEVGFGHSGDDLFGILIEVVEEGLSLFDFGIGFSGEHLQNAKYSVPIAKELGAEVLIICTSAYHLANPGYKAMETFTNELKDTNIIVMTYTKNVI